MYEEFGEILGILVILFYGLTVLDYVVKFINRKFGAWMKTRGQLYQLFLLCMRFILKNHCLFGILSLLFLIMHVFIQYLNYGYIDLIGTVAAVILLGQAVYGIYGKKVKKRPKNWLHIHRVITVLLPIAIAFHVLD